MDFLAVLKNLYPEDADTRTDAAMFLDAAISTRGRDAVATACGVSRQAVAKWSSQSGPELSRDEMARLRKLAGL